MGWAVTGLNDSSFLDDRDHDQVLDSSSQSGGVENSKDLTSAEKKRSEAQKERDEMRKRLSRVVTQPRALLVLPAMVPARAFRKALAKRDEVVYGVQQSCISGNYASSKAGTIQEICDIEAALLPARMYLGRDAQLSVGESGKGLVAVAEAKLQTLKDQFVASGGQLDQIPKPPSWPPPSKSSERPSLSSSDVSNKYGEGCSSVDGWNNVTLDQVNYAGKA